MIFFKKKTGLSPSQAIATKNGNAGWLYGKINVYIVIGLKSQIYFEVILRQLKSKVFSSCSVRNLMFLHSISGLKTTTKLSIFELIITQISVCKIY